MHTVHANGRWVNSLEGQDRAVLGTFDTKEEAVEAGREEASRRLTEHLIHNEDLSVAERNSYRFRRSRKRAEGGPQTAAPSKLGEHSLIR